MSSPTTIAYVPSSHLDLFWLGNYNTTLERGAHVIKAYLDRCLQTDDETFLLETTVFADYFLKRYPDYREPLLRLIREGRVEVGTVFVDRWEHLTPAESLVRNIQMGIAWCKEELGIEPTLATHPDLPSLVPQTSQIYGQAGIRYYVTSRKVFEHGAVWRHVAPDGTSLLYLNWPRHYMYFPVRAGDLPTEDDNWRASGLDVDASRDAFPLGVIPVNGSAADLTDPETFRDRYGDYLWNLVTQNRQKYPEYTFTYTVPSAVLAPYLQAEGLPERHGEIPSVWGVAADEEVAFFRRNRELEYRLLTAETVAAIASHLGLPWLPASASGWQGALYESAFYARNDPIDPEHALDALWQMHVFTEDHNGGGYEGALSSFQKRVIQERAWDYADQIIETGLSSIAAGLETQAAGVLVFNPLGHAWRGPVPIELPEGEWETGVLPVDEQGQPLPAQLDHAIDGRVTAQVWLDAVPPVGHRFVALAPREASHGSGSIGIERTDTELWLETARFRVAIDLATGAVTTLRDRRANAEWGHAGLFNIEALREVGNDVTLRMDRDAPPIASVSHDVEVIASGPVFTRVKLTKTILDAAVSQTITMWSESERIDIETRLRWWGSRNWQLRLALPAVSEAASIAYGTPFFGSAWTEVVADARPRNPDEILPDDYHAYREVQQWLHLAQADAGLLLVTDHPGFHYGDGGLSAVLMRTSPSCGDPRLYWENAGEHVYRFSMLPTDGSWQHMRPFRAAAGILRPPVQVQASPHAGGDLPATQSYLSIHADTTELSAVLPDGTGNLLIRVFEATGTEDSVRLDGPLVEGCDVSLVDLIGRPVGPVHADGGTSFDIAPWRIQTLRMSSSAE